MTRSTTRTVTASAFVTAIGAGLWLPAAIAQDGPPAAPQVIWATVGSAGIPDEKADPKLKFTDASALVKGAGEVVLRYNVAPYDLAAAAGLTSFRMAVCYQDDGSKAQVELWLKEVDMVTGETGVVAAFDSNDFQSDADRQLQEVEICDFQFDFVDHLYYVEARLDRKNGNGKPALTAIQILEGDCS